MTPTILNLVAKIRKATITIILISVSLVALDCGNSKPPGEWGGYWKATTPDGTYILEINEADSTIRDNVFGSIGQWIVVAGEGRPGMTMIINSSGGENALEIVKKTADQITLANGKVLNKVEASESTTISSFGKLKGALNYVFIIGPSDEARDSLYKSYLTSWDTDEMGIYARVVAKYDRFWIANFSSASERQFVVTIDTVAQTMNVSKFISSQGVPGECSTTFTVEPSVPNVVRAIYECSEGEPTAAFYEILANGDLVVTEADDPD